MAKTKISEFSSTPANNTDIDSINIAEGCAPSNINDAIRELMAQLKDFQTGAQGDSFNGPIGTSTAAAGAFTTLTASSTLSVTGAGSIQGLTVGRGAGAVATNTAVGASALAANTSGSENTAVGYQALISETSATNNSAFGVWALRYNTTGSSNVAVGRSALEANTTSSSNTAVGYQALYSNTTGTSSNEAFGREALRTNTTGGFNQAVGNSALYYNTTGSYNVAMGTGALQSNTTASNNTAVGYQAGYSNTTAGVNVYVGYQTGYTNSLSQNNTFVGNQAGYTHNTATLTNGFNTAIGATAGYSLTTGTLNTFIGSGPSGFGSGYYVTTGSKNTILGAYNGNQGGLDIRTASNYIVLSDGDGNPAAQWSGTVWRFGDYTGAPNNVYVRLNHTTGSSNGSSFIAHYYNGTFIGDIAQNGTTAVSYNTTSDYRLKNTIAPMTGALAKVALLKPCTYKWNADGSDGQGFIAHELAEVVPQCVTGEKDAVDEEGNPKYQGIDTSFLVATLTAAIQEQQAIIESLKARLDAANL